jgi:hypothetical protein
VLADYHSYYSQSFSFTEERLLALKIWLQVKIIIRRRIEFPFFNN